MSNNELKKMIIFSSLSRRRIIENIISDEMKLTGKTSSALIEDHLINDMISTDSNVKYYTEYLYSPKGSIRKTAQMIFSNNAVGIDWKSKYDNLFPLVRFCMNKSILSQSTLTGEEPELYHFRSQLDSIIRILEIQATMAEKQLETPSDDETAAYQLKKESKQAEMLLKNATDDPSSVKPVRFYQLIIDNWTYLKGSTFTYRLLSDLTTMENNWTETAESRQEIVDIIRNMAEKWG